MFFMFFVEGNTMKCYYCPRKGASVVPWDSFRLFCGTSTLMKVRVQHVTCLFALHAPAHSSRSWPRSQAPHHQPHMQWILGCTGLRLLL